MTDHPLKKLSELADQLLVLYKAGQRQLSEKDPVDLAIMQQCAVETLRNQKFIKDIVDKGLIAKKRRSKSPSPVKQDNALPAPAPDLAIETEPTSTEETQ